ncbi:MAG: adenosine deaminase [Spirochaetia bacterium]|nr:adenosine deaminase [Spirochaetia bacterium]
MEELYYFKEKAPFEVFQSKFNLIIALSRFNPDEIREISKNVLRESANKDIIYSEFRIMYSPLATESDYLERTLAACIGLSEGEKSNGVKGRLVVSLHRQPGFEAQYSWLKKAMQENQLISEYLVGIDFCNIEEGYPPKNKKDFFKKVLHDNELDQNNSLAILYHVAESFQDKSHISACRWIAEASDYGAHRLGHCIALGETMNKFVGSLRLENKDEFIDTNEYILNNYEEISQYGNFSDYEYFQSNLNKAKSSRDNITIYYDKEFMENLEIFRKFVIQKLKINGTVVETCPSSNYLIGMIDTYENLPVKAFSDTNLRLTIGADDPGIFNIDLQEEYKICESIGISVDKLKTINDNSKYFTSEILSGKKSRPKGFEPPTF